MSGNEHHRDLVPPGVPRWLLRLLPEAHRDQLVGDLAEEFGLRAAREPGPRLAWLWFWRALLSCIVTDILTRLRYRLTGSSGAPGDERGIGPRRRWHGRHLLVGFRGDLRFAVRSLMKNPALAVGAVVMLALGIGVNTAIFSMHTGMSRIVRQFEDPQELVFLWGVEEGWERAPVSALDYFEWRDHTDAFREMAVSQRVTRYIAGDLEPQRLTAVRTSANLLPMLGITAEVGRLHGQADEAPAAPPVVLLTHRFWQERFGGTADVIGRTVQLNDVAHTVIGVLPANAALEFLWHDTGVFTPLSLDPAELSWGDRRYRVMARLADGVALEQAQAQMTTVAARLAEAQPETNANVRARVEPFEHRFYSPSDKLAMGSLLAAVFAVLLIACVNLTNFLLAKGSARQTEVAIRLAVGASRARVVRQLLTESLLLALLGGALGVVLGLWGLDLLLAALPPAPNAPSEVALDPLLFAYALAISVGAAMAFGLTPALMASRVSLGESIKEGGGGKSAGRVRKRFRSGLLVAQLALTVPLALACVVAFRHVQTLGNRDFGFATRGLLKASVDLPTHRYTGAAEQVAFYAEVVEAVRSIPGVTAAAAGLNVPIGAGYRSLYGPLVIEGREDAEGNERGPRSYQVVTPEFFETLGVSLRRGRLFSPADGPEDLTVAVVNEAMVRRYWPGENPIGKRLHPDSASLQLIAAEPVSNGPVTVIGVVADFGATFYGDPPEPTLYVSHVQRPTASMMLVARTGGDPLQLVPALRAAVSAVDAGVPLSAIRTGERLVDDWLQESRAIAASLGVLGFLALGMAVVGLYGMVAYSVAQRTFELGVRMVLGADGGAIRRTVMRSFVTLAGTGLLIGLVVSGVGTVIVRSQLLMLRIPIVSTVGGLVALLVMVVLLASYLPARRATSIEPVRALKCE